MARKEKPEYTERISLAVTPQTLKLIDALAEADFGRPRGVWVRIQLEKLLAEMENGKAKK